MKAWGSGAAVIAAVRDDAAAEEERLQRQADAARLELEKADSGGPAIAATRERRLAAVRQEVADAESAAEWEDAVAAAADRDAWLEAVAAAGRQRLAAEDSALWYKSLASEALEHLPGPSAVLVVPPSRIAATEGLRAALEQECRKAIVVEAGSLAAGCVARTPDGRVTFDNTVEAREQRTRTAWRAAVARCYDAALGERCAAS